MTFLKLHGKLGKQPIANNRQQVTVVLNIGDLRELVEGQVPDWGNITVPLDLCYRNDQNGKLRYFFVLERDKQGRVVQL